MAEQQKRLFERFAELGIATDILPYPAHRTVEEGKALRGDMAGQFTKNLLLKDKRGRLFLIAVHEDRSIDLKTLHRRIGASGQVRFAPADEMRSALGIEPGALTPLALIDDREGRVTVVIDASLLSADQVNFHPLVHTESVGLKPAELLAFIESCGRRPVIVDFSAAVEGSAAAQ